MRLSISVAACVFGMAMGAKSASADSIIFSNLNEANPSPGGYFFGWFQENDEDIPQSESWRALQFEAQVTANLDSITMPVTWHQAAPARGTGSLQIVLYSSDNGLPGTEIESFTRTGESSSPLTQFDSVLHPQLRAGEMYFLAAQSTGYLEGEWFLATSGPHLQTAIRDGFDFHLQPWHQRDTVSTSAFRVTGDPLATPEPATLLLVSGGLVALWRRRSQSCDSRCR
ncbi:MAG: PEP-CTERM sorting domain-containing protein [Gemmatimonadaceae bacterium]